MDRTILPAIAEWHPEAIAIRRAIHARPELGFEERETGDLVARLLHEWGYRVTRLAGTGVVGQMRRGEGRALGLRADMDALPILEATGLAHASTRPGVMHACGHDGHTAMLLAAARHMAGDTVWSGTLNLIFQPAEEGLGGAARMLAEGLFRQFPCDAVFAMHNLPGLPVGVMGFRSGPTMASADAARIRIEGHGGHAAVPQHTVDPVVAGAAIVTALQSIVARNVDPQEAAVISVGSIHAGSAANIIPETAEMSLTIRCLSPQLRLTLEQRIRTLARAQAESFGARALVEYEPGYPVLVNHPAETALALHVASAVLPAEAVIPDLRPAMASEDFALMLEHCPGSYIHIGNGLDGAPLHNPQYDFNDAALAHGASYWVRLARTYLAPQPATQDANAHAQAENAWGRTTGKHHV